MWLSWRYISLNSLLCVVLDYSWSQRKVHDLRGRSEGEAALFLCSYGQCMVPGAVIAGRYYSEAERVSWLGWAQLLWSPRQAGLWLLGSRRLACLTVTPSIDSRGSKGQHGIQFVLINSSSSSLQPPALLPDGTCAQQPGLRDSTRCGGGSLVQAFTAAHGGTVLNVHNNPSVILSSLPLRSNLKL